MFERINRVKCSYGNPANFPRSARESLYACRGVTGGGGGRPSSLVSHEREQLEILSFRIKIRTRDRINHKPSLRVLNLISPINGIHGFRRVRIDKHGDAGGRNSIERVIELFYAAIRLIFLVIDAPSRRAPSGAQRKLRVTAEKLARPAINHARISPDCAARGSYFFVDIGEGGMMMMMKHGHAKRVINSCPSRVSPFYRARYRHHLEGNSPGLVRAMRATRVFNKRLFFQ